MIDEEYIFSKVIDLMQKGFTVSFYQSGQGFVIRLYRNNLQANIAVTYEDIKSFASSEQARAAIVLALINAEEKFDGK